MKYINIHRHGPAEVNEFGIENLYKNFEKAPGSYFSAGLHPWYITDETWKSQYEQLESLSRNAPQMLAVGECGLDKVCDTDFHLQEKVFTAQVMLANHSQKPLIIHCVRAFDEVMQVLKNNRNTVPVIFHGFNKHKVLAQQLAGKGFYLSFGKALQKDAVKETFGTVPLSQVFLETDDAGIDIAGIYRMAAAAAAISEETLSLQLQKNLSSIFKIAL